MTMKYKLDETVLEDLDKGFCVLEVLFDPDEQANDYRFLTTNAAFERQSGLANAEGACISALSARVEQEWLDAFGRVAKSGRAERFELHAPSFGRWYDAYAFPVSTVLRHHVGVLFNNITGRKEQEARLRRSREVFKALVTAGTYSAFRMSTDGRIMYPVDSESLERTADPIVDWIDKLIPSESRAHVRAAVDEAIATKSRFELEHPVLFAGDKQRWVLSRAVPVMDAQGTITEWFGVGTDITERRKVEEALRKSEERLRQFAQASSNILWMRDADTLQWTYLSPAFERIYGLSCQEALCADNPRAWLELVEPDDRARVSAAIQRAREGERITFEYRVRRPRDGELRWLRDTGFPITEEAGKVVLIGGIGQDVTEIRRAQERLEASEERLRASVEVGRLGLWDWNVRTGAIHWSDEHFRMQGYEVGEVMPSYEAWKTRVHPDDRERLEHELHRARETQGEFVAEFRTLHPDGTVRWLNGRGRFFYDVAGQPVRMIGAMIDTTERRELEDRQRVLVAELQHRTRNLMGIIRAVADKTVLASSGLPDFRSRFRGRLDALARVQGLLSRLKEHDRVTFDELICSEITAMNGEASRVRLSGPKGVRLRSSTVQMLAMALHELATNALKYGALGQPDGQLTITWTLEENGAGSRPWLHVEWRETGVEMPPDTAPRGAGQGRELIENALPYQLGAKTRYSFTPDGLHCVISVPVSTAAEAA
ncbi:MAG: PAS domain S-box protein [Alphaproteobacteria bacterium]|nr:PAS domain S-box protein [Alphaproteobacteria bacterium]